MLSEKIVDWQAPRGLTMSRRIWESSADGRDLFRFRQKGPSRVRARFPAGRLLTLPDTGWGVVNPIRRTAPLNLWHAQTNSRAVIRLITLEREAPSP